MMSMIVRLKAQFIMKMRFQQQISADKWKHETLPVVLPFVLQVNGLFLPLLLRWILASLLSHRSPMPIPWGSWLWSETLSVVQGHIQTGW
jgi:hypothetical protein